MSNDDDAWAGALAALGEGLERAETRGNSPIPGLRAAIEADVPPEAVAAMREAQQRFGSKRRSR